MCLFQECVKIVVFVFNLIFVLVGAALITIGTLFKLNFQDINKVIPESHDHFELIPIFTIVVGCIIFLVAFFGCCGALKSSSCLLTTYAIILLVIFIGQIALGVFAFLEINDRNDLATNVNRTVDKIFTKTGKTDLEATDFIQKELKCCGTYNSTFWEKELHKKIPKSCFDKNSQQFQEGCRTAVFDFLISSSKIIGITVLALAATEVIGATFSLCLSNSIRNDVRRNQYY